jgi:hypothetical protein
MSLNPKKDLKGQGLKAKPKTSPEERASTKDTQARLQRNILPFHGLGLKFRAIDVFWHNFGEEETRYVDGDSSRIDDLKTARPPDGLSPNWRYCHMGILLQAFVNREDDARLTVAIHHHPGGINLEFEFGETSLDVVVANLRPDQSRPIFSAGVMRDIDVELTKLSDFVSFFLYARYNLLRFNCQHFTALLYLEFTGRNFKKTLECAWTPNNFVNWMSNSTVLMNWMDPVTGDPLLFYYTPPADATLGRASDLFGTAAVQRFPAVAIAAVAVAARLEVSIHNNRFSSSFEKSVIWFKYVPSRNEWYWSPYQKQEHEGDDHWISVSEHVVSRGRFARNELQGKALSIASVLANNNFNPLTPHTPRNPPSLSVGLHARNPF